jgi:hypothetical protein
LFITYAEPDATVLLFIVIVAALFVAVAVIDADCVSLYAGVALSLNGTGASR